MTDWLTGSDVSNDMEINTYGEIELKNTTHRCIEWVEISKWLPHKAGL